MKPDGWCAQNKDEDWMLCSVAYDSYHATAILYDQLDASGQEQEDEGWQIKPVCLVPPELLDWVENVKRAMEVQSSGWCRELTNQLDKIWPEKKEE